MHDTERMAGMWMPMRLRRGRGLLLLYLEGALALLPFNAFGPLLLPLPLHFALSVASLGLFLGRVFALHHFLLSESKVLLEVPARIFVPLSQR
jgi:hypothetical protein